MAECGPCCGNSGEGESEVGLELTGGLHSRQRKLLSPRHHLSKELSVQCIRDLHTL